MHALPAPPALQARSGVSNCSLELDHHGRYLLVLGQYVSLSPLEWRLMEYFFNHQGMALSRDLLLNDVWGRHYEASSNVVDVVVASLRKKLGPKSYAIQTISRYGYRFKASEADS